MSCTDGGNNRSRANDAFVRRGAGHAGVTWHFTRPPVQNLEFEVDCRSVRVEEVL